jgi:hypothetical protein
MPSNWAMMSGSLVLDSQNRLTPEKQHFIKHIYTPKEKAFDDKTGRLSVCCSW